MLKFVFLLDKMIPLDYIESYRIYIPLCTMHEKCNPFINCVHAHTNTYVCIYIYIDIQSYMLYIYIYMYTYYVQTLHYRFACCECAAWHRPVQFSGSHLISGFHLPAASMWIWCPSGWATKTLDEGRDVMHIILYEFIEFQSP